MKKYGVVYDGCYSHIVMVKSEKEAEQHEVTEYYDLLPVAKKAIIDYLEDQKADIQLAIKQVRTLTEEDF